jgi:hypothetical protein
VKYRSSLFSNAFCILTVLFLAIGCSSAAFADQLPTTRHQRFDFSDASVDNLKKTHPELWAIIAQGVSEREARLRYEHLMQAHPEHLASALNVMTALSQIDLNGDNATSFVKALIWDGSEAEGGSGTKDLLACDRLYGWVDENMVAAVSNSVGTGQFHRVHALWVFHRGATSSFKQAQFSRGDVHISFYEHQTHIVDGVLCVKAQIHIDLYRSPRAHTFREVIPHLVARTKTNPCKAYQLRSNVARKEGDQQFAPPYKIVRATGP